MAVVNSRSNVSACCTSQCLLTGYWMSTHQTLTSDWTVKLVLYRTPPENPTAANTRCVPAANVTLRFHFTQLSETHSLISHTDDRRVKKKSIIYYIYIILSCWFFWSEWILLQELHTRTDGGQVDNWEYHRYHSHVAAWLTELALISYK